MTREDIIRMARDSDSGFDGGADADGTMTDSLVGIAAIIRFAELVAAAEREMCANVCDELMAYDEDDPMQTCANAIRDRGTK